MRLIPIGLAAVVFSGLPVWAAELPKEGRDDQRVRFVNYNPFQVVQIVGALRTSTQIEFASDETVVHATVGNPIWEIAPTGNLVFVKPKEMHPATNMQVVTQRPDGTQRSYQIELGLMPPDRAAKNPPFLLVKYKYPSDEQLRRQQIEAAATAERKAAQVDQVLTRDEANGPRNYAYSVQGETAFEPVEVYDNGKTTTLRFSGNIEMPAIYATAEDGSEELIPKTVTGDGVLVHAVARKLVLRRGDQVLCVFNENYSPEGIDPHTRTTSPSVARVVATDSARKPVGNIGRSAHSEAAPGLASGPVVIGK